MSEESIYNLGAEALNLFARKGDEGGPHIHQGGQENGVKVRRIMQITRDLSQQPFPKLRILDLGCGEGVYAIEAGLRGAEVIALDARTQRMDKGAACAMRHGLKNVRFIREDVRHVTQEVLGSFNVVYLLGLLYHLDAPDLFPVLENIYSLCTGILIIDTLISMTEEIQVSWRGHIYPGRLCREHADDDTDEIRRSRVLKSIDNTFSFRFTRESLLRAICNIGFTSAYECHIPFEPGKAEDRITIVAVKGVPVLLSTYPWVNYKSEADIREAIRQFIQSKAPLENAGGDL
jgi:2-polyprenyl-3-methyl-5-hydroxy-6-metoxy-1,4-benzoquinol methylase